MKKNFTPIALPYWTFACLSAGKVVVPLHTPCNAVNAVAYSPFTSNISNIAVVPLKLAGVAP